MSEEKIREFLESFYKDEYDFYSSKKPEWLEDSLHKSLEKSKCLELDCYEPKLKGIYFDPKSEDLEPS